jgi:mercuric ion binding protein
MKYTLVFFLVMMMAPFAWSQTTPVMVKKSAKAVVSEQTAVIKVLGNCGMCRKTIEKAATEAGAIRAFWNEDTHQLSVTFNQGKSSVEAIQKAVALSGYDNEGFKAPDNVYQNLHSCCQYDRSGAPSSAKSCEEPAAPKN